MKGTMKFGLSVMACAMVMSLAFGVKAQANQEIAKGEVGYEFYNKLSTGNGEKAQVVKYRIIKKATGAGREKGGEVEVIGCTDDAKKIVIQASIPLDEVHADLTYYRTKRIVKGCFKNNKKLTWVQINDCDLTEIPEDCFSGCTNLKTVQIQDPQIKTINKKAFNNCKKLKTFEIASKKLTKSSVKSKSFKNVAKMTVYAPSESKAKKYASWFKSRGAKVVLFDELDDDDDDD